MTGPPEQRANWKRRLPGVLSLLAILLLLALGGVSWYVSWERGRWLLESEFRRAIDREPRTYEALQDDSGPFTDYSLTCSAPIRLSDKLLIYDLYQHPWTIENSTWFEGRGGRDSVAYLRYINAHVEVPTNEGPYEFCEYLIYFSDDGLILGWVDVTEGPTIEDLLEPYRSNPSRAGEDDRGED